MFSVSGWMPLRFPARGATFMSRDLLENGEIFESSVLRFTGVNDDFALKFAAG